jgi:hypothetical protein
MDTMNSLLGLEYTDAKRLFAQPIGTSNTITTLEVLSAEAYSAAMEVECFRHIYIYISLYTYIHTYTHTHTHKLVSAFDVLSLLYPHFCHDIANLQVN